MPLYEEKKFLFSNEKLQIFVETGLCPLSKNFIFLKNEFFTPVGEQRSTSRLYPLSPLQGALRVLRPLRCHPVTTSTGDPLRYSVVTTYYSVTEANPSGPTDLRYAQFLRYYSFHSYTSGKLRYAHPFGYYFVIINYYSVIPK